MQKFILVILTIILAGMTGTSAQTQQTKALTRKQIKAEQDTLDSLCFEQARKAIADREFILEADQVIFKYGTTAFVSANTNFVAIHGDKAVVQVAFNIPVSGPNGLGGVTVTGNVSSFRQSVDKRGNISVTMNVMGAGISALVEISLPQGGNNASVYISPNFNANRFSLSGTLLPLSKANVFQGSSF